MFKKDFTLTQHTPLLHFEHDIPGATLRATELKPKLDKYLLEKESNLKGYHIPGQPTALDYKVRIIVKKPPEIWETSFGYTGGNNRQKTDHFPAFFGNTKEEKFRLVYHTEPIALCIRSFHTELISTIQQQLQNFFFHHNFGARQSKGFGSFTYTPDEAEQEIPANQDQSYYSFVAKMDETYGKKNFSKFSLPYGANKIGLQEEYIIQRGLFQRIDLLYKTLRSGINQQGYYFKSLLFQYAKEKLNLSWDKRFIKEKFLQPKKEEERKKNGCKSPDITIQLNKHKDKKCLEPLKDDNNPNNVFIRDILGLSTDQNYPENKYPNYGFVVRHPLKSDKHQSGYNHLRPNTVERWNSPLLIKPIRIRGKNSFTVFIIPQEIPESLFGAKQTVLKVKRYENGSEEILDEIHGNIIDRFNLKDYLKYAFQTNLKSYVKNCGGDTEHEFHKFLEDAYSELNNKVQS